MKSLTTPKGKFGPFATVETLADRYRCDNNDLPFSVVGEGVIDEWTGPLPTPAFDLSGAIKSAVLKIDADADKIYGDVVGNKSEEYRSAEADAKAFVAAGYTGVAGSGVTSWATAKGWTTTQAANDIIAQATAWRGAQAAIRTQRLGKKEAVKAATDSAAIDALMGQWTAFVTGIRTQLGV